MIDKTVANYKIIKEIGTGGMGTVYMAENINIGNRVAIKMLHSHLVKNAELKTHILNEARTQAALNHPSITKVIDFVSNDQGLFIILEFVEGETLSDMLFKTHRSLSENEANQYMAEILDAVGYAHSKNIVHRDLKSANIIVMPNKGIKIMDFGIAKMANEAMSLTQTNTRIGSPLYMSPEQVTGGSVDFRSDIYSLGLVYHEMLTGKPIYDQGKITEYEIYNKIVKQHLPRLKDFNQTSSENAQEIIDTATAKLPIARFQNCLEFKNALKLNADLNKTSTQKLPPNKKGRTNQLVTDKPFVKKKSAKKFSILLLVSLLILFGGGTYFYLQKKGETKTNDLENNELKLAAEAFKQGNYKKGHELYSQIEPRNATIDSKLSELISKSDAFEKVRVKAILQPHLKDSTFITYLPKEENKLEALLKKFASIEMEFMILQGDNKIIGEGKYMPQEKMAMNGLKTYYVAKKYFLDKNFRLADSLLNEQKYDAITYITDLRAKIKKELERNNLAVIDEISSKKREEPIAVKKINEIGLIIAEPYAKIRSGTSANSDLLGDVNEGETVFVIEQDVKSGWYKVRKNTISGYVAKKSIRLGDSNSEEVSLNDILSEDKSSKGELNEPLFYGTWRVEDENANYVFNSNHKGNYTNSRGKNKAFNWSITGLFLNIKMVDGPVFVWQVRSHSSTRIVMDDMQNNIFDRVLNKN
jgi:serine/threonine protein kinase